MLNWSANLTLLFKEVPFLERLQAAAEAGFGAVEFMWPTGVDLDALVAARDAAGVQVALFNVDSGDVPAGDRGFANDPAKRDWWRERVGMAIELAERLGCSRLNVQAGKVFPLLGLGPMLECLRDNLRWALEQAPGITFFLEPLNPFEHPRYLLRRTADALSVLEQVNHPRLKVQFDVYHAQRTEGNITALLRAHMDKIGHIQIADSPERHQPGTGEIHWRYVFAQVEALGYSGFIGLEYNPAPDTMASLGWLPYEHRIACRAEDVRLA